MASISRGTDQQARDGATIHESRAFARLRTFKQGLVLDLFLRRGAFWESVRGLREERGLTSSVQLPPTAAGRWAEPIPLLPADAPEHPGFRAPPKEKLDFFEFSSRWSDDIDSIMLGVLPDELRHVLDHRTRGVSNFYDGQYLRAFGAACVLYDPPETKLLEFAEYRNPRAHRAGDLSDARSLVTKRVEMKMHPIEELPIRSEELQKLERFYETLLAEIAERLRTARDRSTKHDRGHSPRTPAVEAQATRGSRK